MASPIETYFLSVIAEQGRPGPTASTLRGVLGGFANLYDLGLEAYLAGEKFGLRRRAILPVPVISIGNLTVGGTGKTPMTQMLGRRLQAEGKQVAVLSRGHGGDSQRVRLVSGNDGQVCLSASEAGDEPALLARTLRDIPVMVGKDRRQSAREALRRHALDTLILDDGFQFWQLARDLDIVLLDARRPFDNGFPLPRGLLREPKRHLRRAGIVVVTRAAHLTQDDRNSRAAQVFRLAPEASLYFADHQAQGFVPVSDLLAPMHPLDILIGQPVYAVSAIAQPQSFVQSLEEQAGVRIVGQQMWDDHHAYDAVEVRNIHKAAVQCGAKAIVMTEKDAVKWPAADSGSLPVYALRIEMVVENEAEFLREVGQRANLG